MVMTPLRGPRTSRSPGERPSTRCSNLGLRWVDDRDDAGPTSLRRRGDEAAATRVGLPAHGDQPGVELYISDGQSGHPTHAHGSARQEHDHVAPALMLACLDDRLSQPVQRVDVGKRQVPPLGFASRAASSAVECVRRARSFARFRGSSPSRTASPRTSTSAAMVFLTVDLRYSASRRSLARRSAQPPACRRAGARSPAGRAAGGRPSGGSKVDVESRTRARVRQVKGPHRSGGAGSGVRSAHRSA